MTLSQETENQATSSLHSNAGSNIPGQLTRYPVGSVRELWTLSYPLMISLLSVGIMIFCDRLFLASISVEAFTGVSEAAMFFMAFEFSIVTLAAISEVLVGRNFGARNYEKIGSCIWAMIWMSVFSTAIFLPCGICGGDLLFYGSPYAETAKQFFCTLCFFGPFLPLNAALSSFWIGRGRVAFITTAVALCSALNMLLDFFLIFGTDTIPSLGVFGAALGTGISQVVLSIVLFASFLRQKYRLKYNTAKSTLDFATLKLTCSLGFPQALAMLIQCLAWACFFRVMSLASEQHALICGIAQAVFFFFNFVIEGVSKAAASVVANLIGAKRFSDIKSVLFAGIRLLAIVGCVLFFIIFSSPDRFLQWFLPSNFSYSDEVQLKLYSSLFWIWLTLMSEAVLFLFGGVLLAFGDSRFILMVSSVAVWLFGVLPAAVATLVWQQGPEVALALACCYYAAAGTAYWVRIRQRMQMIVSTTTSDLNELKSSSL